MYKSIYKIKKMDCPSEKSIIEMKLSEGDFDIKKMEFNFQERILTLYHSKKDENISILLEELKLGTSRKSIEKLKDWENISKFDNNNEDKKQKKLLLTVFGINFGFFIFEFFFGLFSNSMGLVADSLDMLSDATIYFISLFAIGGTILMKKKIAKIAGIFQIILSLIGIFEVLRRFFFPEQNADFRFMIAVAILAFIGNYYSLYLFNKQNSCDAHMKASQICTSNDLIVNTGVIISGILVYLLGSNMPDLIIGIIIFIIVLNGSIQILKLSK